MASRISSDTNYTDPKTRNSTDDHGDHNSAIRQCRISAFINYVFLKLVMFGLHVRLQIELLPLCCIKDFNIYFHLFNLDSII